MTSTTNIVTMRVEGTLVQRIDESVERAGLTRTAYIVSWLPDAGVADALERINGFRITDAGLRHTARARKDDPTPPAIRVAEERGR
jgi:hypothetical protein